MHCKRTVTTVQRGHTRIIKVLILWLNVFNTGEIEYDLTTGKKFTYEALVIALKKKKNSKLVTNFPDFTSIFKTFVRSGKLLGKFQEFKTVRTLKRTKMQRELTSAGGIRYDGNKFCSIHKTVPLWYNAIENTTFNVQLYSNNSLKTVVLKRQSLSFKQLLNADLVVIAKAKNTGNETKIRNRIATWIHGIHESHSDLE